MVHVPMVVPGPMPPPSRCAAARRHSALQGRRSAGSRRLRARRPRAAPARAARARHRRRNARERRPLRSASGRSSASVSTASASAPAIVHQRPGDRIPAPAAATRARFQSRSTVRSARLPSASAVSSAGQPGEEAALDDPGRRSSSDPNRSSAWPDLEGACRPAPPPRCRRRRARPPAGRRRASSRGCSGHSR